MRGTDANIEFDKYDGYDIFCNPKIEYNAYNRLYQAKMSHIEMVEACTRSNCSDFLLGNSHCWEASPMILPETSEWHKLVTFINVVGVEKR